MDFRTLKKRIKNLEVQGAKEIALASLRFFEKYCSRYGFDKKFFRMASELEKIRPTAVVLHNCLEILSREKSVEKIRELIEVLERADERIARYGAKLIPKGSAIMTYCHSSEALSVIKRAYDGGRVARVYAPETRPKFQGVKTAKELAKHGIETVLITDNARGVFIKDCDLVLVGSDAMRKEGNVNKIGTFTLALLARHFAKPFYIAGCMLKLDFRKRIKIEERPPSEIANFRMKNLAIRNPAFDITPWKFISKVITDKGAFAARKIVKMLGKKSLPEKF